jgi:hypothetical protein
MKNNKQQRLMWVIWLLAMVLWPQQTFAHGNAPEGKQVAFTQRIGVYDLLVMVESPVAVPGILLVDFSPLGTAIPDRVIFRVAPRGQSFERAIPTVVQTLAGPQGVYYSEIAVDRAGDWEIEVQVEGLLEGGVAVLPVAIVPATLPAYSIELSIALASIALLLVTGLALGAIDKGSATGVPAWLHRTIGQGVFAAFIVSIVFGGLMWQETASQSATNTTAASVSLGGRPHVNVTLSSQPAIPQAQQELQLTFELSDGGTGLPVDDLVSHHEALIHMVVLDESGAFMLHDHPPRLAPGRYQISFTPDRPGRYRTYIELERTSSGTQVIEREFLVAGTPVEVPAIAAGLGQRTLDTLQVNITSSVERIRAGQQTTLNFRFSELDGKPTQDLAPWLGMAGHMFARSTDQEIFAHVHAAEVMAPANMAGLGMRYGPDVRFVYTFPRAGEYRIWAQFQHENTILTVPLTLRVDS